MAATILQPKNNCMDKTVMAQVAATLSGEGKTYNKLDLEVRQLLPDENTGAIKNAIRGEALSPTSPVKVEDGSYTIRYVFDARTEEHRARVPRRQADGGLSCLAGFRRELFASFLAGTAPADAVVRKPVHSQRFPFLGGCD